MRIIRSIIEPKEKNVIWAKPNSTNTYDEFIWGNKGWEPVGGSGGGPGGPEVDPIYTADKASLATKAWVQEEFYGNTILHKPEVFTIGSTMVKSFTLDKAPLFTTDVLVLDGSSNLHYLQDSDFTISGRIITINNPTLTPGMKVKVNYAYIYGN